MWIEGNFSKSYDDFLYDLNNGIVEHYESESYSFYTNIIKNFIGDEYIETFSDCTAKLRAVSNVSTFDLSTSGTTSKKKIVKVNLGNCLRGLKETEKGKNVWGLCYPYYSFASSQVFFQSFFNEDTIINFYNSDSDFKKVVNDIVKYNVNRITCTPTYLKMICLNTNEYIKNIKSITLGGERVTGQIISHAKEYFPKAKIINIYASTEAGTLLYSNDHTFSIPSKAKNKIKIIKNELVVHKDLLNPSKNLSVVGEWFHTGDMVEFVTSKKFIFKSRVSSYVNIGGKRISMEGIEDILNNFDFIKDCRVYSQENSILGTVICADIVSNISSVAEIKKNLRECTEKENIPTIIKVVDKLAMNETGKKIRA